MASQLLPLLLILPYSTTLSPLLLLFLLLLFLYLSPGGLAWALSFPSSHLRGPSGLSAILASPRPHRLLSRLAHRLHSTHLMAFSVGFTRFIISSHPDTAKEILHSSDFADRPLKLSARELLFDKAMGFAPSGENWRRLRRISATHFFSPRRIHASSEQRRLIGLEMGETIRLKMEKEGSVAVREVMTSAALRSMMLCVFGRREEKEVERMVREGYELLGAFNWADHLPAIGWLDLGGVRSRCRRLAREVEAYVGEVINDHRKAGGRGDNGDFVDVLLAMEKEMGLSQPDMIAVLWELIFRGTDTVAILLEWLLARLVLHPDVQRKAREELDAAVAFSGRPVSEADLPNLRYIQAVIKETLRLHPPGPLLSWARLAIRDTTVGGHRIPAGTTGMVNMWSITHDERNWRDPETFRPERFVEEDVGVMGCDLRIAPFGSGRRVCPGKALGMASVELWVAQMVQGFEWAEGDAGVDLGECLKMSMEMERPLVCRALARPR